MQFILDTNTVIYFLDGTLPPKGFSFLLNHLQQQECVLSVITKIETLGFQFPTKISEQKSEKFVLSLPLAPLSEDIVNKTIEIRKLTKIKVADATIGASAIIHGLTLVSRNEKDFKNLPGLNFINPFTL